MSWTYDWTLKIYIPLKRVAFHIKTFQSLKPVGGVLCSYTFLPQNLSFSKQMARKRSLFNPGETTGLPRSGENEEFRKQVFSWGSLHESQSVRKGKTGGLVIGSARRRLGRQRQKTRTLSLTMSSNHLIHLSKIKMKCYRNEPLLF